MGYTVKCKIREVWLDLKTPNEIPTKLSCEENTNKYLTYVIPELIPLVSGINSVCQLLSLMKQPYCH